MHADTEPSADGIRAGIRSDPFEILVESHNYDIDAGELDMRTHIISFNLQRIQKLHVHSKTEAVARRCATA